MTLKKTVSVVIPAFNSEASLPLLLERLAPVLSSLGNPFEVIVVDDGSVDGSGSILRQLSTRYPWLLSITLGRNFGQHNALLCGIRSARHDVIVTLDDDLQNPPEEIPKLLACLDEGYDVVYGVPQQRHYTLMRGLATALTKWALRITMRLKIAPQISAFRAFRTPLRDSFSNFNSPYVSIDVLLSWGTTRFGAVPVRHDPRVHGASQYTLRKLFAHTLNIMAGFSVFPLRLAATLGLCLSGLGALTLIYVVARYFMSHGSVPGFPFLASIIAIFSGAQLFALGVLGEYLARVYLSTMGRPAYSVNIAQQNDHV